MIKQIIKSLGVVFLTVAIVFAATNISLESGAPITKEVWDEVVSKINTLETANTNLLSEIESLKTENSTQQTQIDNFVQSSGDTMVEISHILADNPSSWKTWTISGLTPNKPLVIGLNGTISRALVRLKVISGAKFGHSVDGYSHILRTGPETDAGTTPSFVLVPISDTVKISIKATDANWVGGELYAYQ